MRSRLLALLAALTLALPLGASLPGSNAVLAADAAAPGGRLVVVWKSDAAKARGPHVGVANIKSIAHRVSVVTAPAGQSGTLAASLRADPGVASVVPDAVASIDAWPEDGGQPDDTYYAGYQWDLDKIGMPQAWTLTTGVRSTVVAVLDTGFNTHIDFDSSAIVSPRNIITGTGDITDGHGHGTHVSGTIAATSNNDAGVAGIAPGVSLMPVKVLNDYGSGFFSDILSGIDWARTHGADVINLSLGGYLTPDQGAAYQPIIDAALGAGVVIVAATGNEGANGVSSFYPAAFSGVIAVGATADDDTRAVYSNAGPVNVMSAPGSNILSLDNDGQGYLFNSGTSMAAPHVSGAVALLETLHPDETVGQVTETLCASSVDLGDAGKDDVFGCGRLDVFAALTLDVPPVPEPTPTPVPTATPTPDPTSTPTPTPTPTPVPTATPTPAIVAPKDVAAPKLKSRTPGVNKTGISRTVKIRIVFNETVKGISAKTIWLVNTRTGVKLKVTVRYSSSSRTGTMKASKALVPLTRYRVVIRRGITDAAGNRLATRSWVFKTRH